MSKKKYKFETNDAHTAEILAEAQFNAELNADTEENRELARKVDEEDYESYASSLDTADIIVTKEGRHSIDWIEYLDINKHFPETLRFHCTDGKILTFQHNTLVLHSGMNKKQGIRPYPVRDLKVGDTICGRQFKETILEFAPQKHFPTLVKLQLNDPENTVGYKTLKELNNYCDAILKR